LLAAKKVLLVLLILAQLSAGGDVYPDAKATLFSRLFGDWQAEFGEELFASRRFSYIRIRLVGGYGIQPVSKIQFCSACKGANLSGNFQKNRRGYIFGSLFAEEPMDAESENPLIVQLVQPCEGIGFCAGPPDQIIADCSPVNLRHRTNHCR